MGDLNLCIDCGNTRLKWGLFDDQHRLLEHGQIATLEIQHWIPPKNFGKVMVSTVAANEFQIRERLGQSTEVFVLSSETPLPFQSLYSPLQKMGSDRKAAICGGLSRGFDPFIVISLGSCVTFDLFHSQHLGGSISPGYRMRLQAMHSFTQLLPFPEASIPKHMPARSTLEALQDGAYHGLRHELLGRIQEIRKNYPEIPVLLTGGDASVFEDALGNTIFALPSLILEGLNYLLKRHV